MGVDPAARTARVALTFAGKTFEVADLAQVPWPKSAGGNTTCCPLDQFNLAHHAEHQRPPTEAAVVQALRLRSADVARCWHHRRPPAELHYAAELSCWFVEEKVQPFLDVIVAVVARDGRFSRDVAADVNDLFVDPLTWSFTAGAELSNGRHRSCALKLAQVTRVAVVRLG